MKPIGWEIRPFGWLLILLIIGFLAYRVFRWLQCPPAEPERHT